MHSSWMNKTKCDTTSHSESIGLDIIESLEFAVEWTDFQSAVLARATLSSSIRNHWMAKANPWSQCCEGDAGVCFTFIVLYTSRQSQIPVTMFTKSDDRAGLLWDNSFVQWNSHNTRLYASLASAFLCCRWHQQALFCCDVSTVPAQPSLSITVNGTELA